ncbi:hypothetical protein GCM10010182_78500 [Actinomadura cremea]|nr:hypothetical protein GCM10010182_78500 [Actinomadura cremea]
MARALPGYRGNTRLGEILRLGDRGSASPGESWTKVAVIDAGFPRPMCQVPVMGPHDRLLYVDLGYEQFRVGLEYDGERHHTGSQARDRDRRRRKWLAEEQKWELIPVTRDFLSRPAPYLEALLTALLHRGWTPDDTTLDRIGRRLRTLTRLPPLIIRCAKRPVMARASIGYGVVEPSGRCPRALRKCVRAC